MERAIAELVTSRLSKLSDIWEKMGLDRDALAVRHETVAKVVEKQLQEMIDEEEKWMARIIKDIETHMRDRARLAKELEVALQDPDEGLALIRLEHILRTEANSLKSKKEERMVVVLELKREDEALCRSVDEEPHYVSETVVPTTSQLEALKCHIATTKALKVKRLGEFTETKLLIIQLLETLEMEPEGSFERTVVCEDDSSVILSEDTLSRIRATLARLEEQQEANRKRAEMYRDRIEAIIAKLNKGQEEQIDPEVGDLQGHSPAELRELKKKVDELEVLKTERIGQFIHATRMELVDYWDKCHYSQEERDKFDPFYADEFTEELLEKHEAEVEAIKTYFVENEGLFAKIARRQALWRRMIELEEAQKDPNRLKKARGTQLLDEERDKKRINKQLPKLDEELRMEMDRFEATNGAPFLVGGVPYADFIEAQVYDHEAHQMEERTAKAQAKKQENIHATIYGTATPAKSQKRKAAASTSATPYNESKRARGATTTLGVTAGTLTRSQIRSPAFKNKSRAAANLTKSGRKPGVVGQRRVLGDRNDSVIRGNNTPAAFNPTLTSIDSVSFFKDMPKTALTSTFNFTPESKNKTRAQQFQNTPGGSYKRTAAAKAAASTATSSSTATFKTPSSRIKTPANRGGKMASLRSGRQIPFIL